VALAGHPHAITIAYAVASDMDSLNSIHLGEHISASSFMASRGYASAFAEWEKQYTNVKFENLAPDRRTEKAGEAHSSQYTSIKDRLMGTIRTMETDDLVVILAHNAHGELRFGDGSSCQVTEVTAGKGKIWVLSCGTFDYVSGDTELSLGTTNLLTYSDAVAAVRRTLESANNSEATFRDFLFEATKSSLTSKAPAADVKSGNDASQENQIFGIVETNVIEFKCGQYA
jgi:hypothetical protein